MIPILSLLTPIVGKVLDKIPDAGKRAELQLELQKVLTQHEGELLKNLLEADKGQMEINKIEAQHADFYVAGARPTVLWICNIALGWMFILQPMVQTILYWFHQVAEPGKLDSAGILGLTTSLLGFGGMRMYESIKGVERSNLKEF